MPSSIKIGRGDSVLKCLKKSMCKVSIWCKTVLSFKYISIIIVGLNSITNRPQGARNCHNFNDNSKNNFAQLTGMPSGHSQSMGFWAGYKLKKIVFSII